MSDRLSVQRTVTAPPAAVYALLTDPAGHVQIDASGMLMSAEGERVRAVGDRFTVHMDRRALGDLDWTAYDVQVVITALEPDRLVEWTVEGRMKPPLRHRYGYLLEPDPEGTLVTSYCDWSDLHEDYRGVATFPVVPESALRATLGILARTVQ